MLLERIGPKRPVRWYLREWRESRGLSQTGRQRFNEDWINKAAFALGLNDPNLLFRHPDNAMADQLMERMDDEQRVKAIAILKALAS